MREVGNDKYLFSCAFTLLIAPEGRLMKFVPRVLVWGISLLGLAGTTVAETPPATPPRVSELALTDEETDFFEKKVRPLLVQHCYECHAADSKKRGGGLLLDSRDGVRRGGDTGAVIVPYKPDESLLVTAVRYSDESLKMPPKGKLPEGAIALLEEWVKRGAPDPRAVSPRSAPANSWDESLRIRRQWWSLQPVRKPAIPPTKDTTWSDNPVDRFILERLEGQQLSPAAAADPAVLLRRLFLVLTGLPPTPEQVVQFVAEFDEEQRAAVGSSLARPIASVEKQVDALLGSPHFGERWARHWLDVVRFSETHGNEWNYEVHHAWRYRDYLIRAFNDDLPYDQFVREHLAGDRISPPRWNVAERFNESVIGTAFFRFGEVPHDDCIDLPQIGFDIADNQVDTLSKAFQATTVACARCHDHKIDAVSMQDYYGLLGILRSSRLVSHTIDAPDANEATIERLKSLKRDIHGALAEVWLREVEETGRYLLAADAERSGSNDANALAQGLDSTRLGKWIAALDAAKMPLDDPLYSWRTLALAVECVPELFGDEWAKLAEAYAKEAGERDAFERNEVEVYADFRHGVDPSWQIGGQGLRTGPSASGGLALSGEDNEVLSAILPGGLLTHAVSDRLNGTLRSPVLQVDRKHISFEVFGRHSSALRLVANNCQLNYRNYRALISDDPAWVTFPVPENHVALRVFAELMTKFDNPKFPDQLSALGGDKANYKLPWEQAAANPRSYFGITRVVLHDHPEPPRPELTHLRELIGGEPPANLPELAERYTRRIGAALRAWAARQATDDDVRWINSFLRRGLLGNTRGLSARLDALVRDYRALEATLEPPRIVPGVADDGPGFDQPMFVRGDCVRPGSAAPRRYLEVLSQPTDRFVPTGSGRLELAQRIASSDNPLTARVMVNRIWHHLFGAGLVRTVDDFGHVGDLPSHPELLDWLAVRFVEEGWSIKRLIRAIVLSRTFQLASVASPASREVDPQNRLLQHYPARRMEAEGVRDSILAASGRLDRTLYGMSVSPFRENENADRRLFPGPLDGGGRRSLYVKNTLMEAPKFLEAFNFPGGKVTQGRRDETNVPAQALALLNDPFVLQQADLWGSALAARSDSLAARIEYLFAVALGRTPRGDEPERFAELARQLAALYQVPEAGLLKNQLVWRDMAHAMFNLKEFIYIP